MRKFCAHTCCLMAVALLALPATAASAAVVPPGNSAANQYTEAFPTAGGQATPGKTMRGHGGGPIQVLGNEETRQLEAAGPSGRALAEIVAETAPAGVASVRSDGKGGSGEPSGSKDGSQGQPEGSSAVREVLGQATGSSGDTGLLLPILVLATLVGAAAYWMRNRSRTEPPPKPL